MSGEWDVCGRQHDSVHWLAPSHDPVVMGGGVMHQISQVVRTKAMLTQATWWEANERFLLYCLPLHSFSCSHHPTHLVPTDNKASELKRQGTLRAVVVLQLPCHTPRVYLPLLSWNHIQWYNAVCHFLRHKVAA